MHAFPGYPFLGIASGARQINTDVRESRRLHAFLGENIRTLDRDHQLELSRLLHRSRTRLWS